MLMFWQITLFVKCFTLHSSPLSVPWDVGWADPSTVIATAISAEGWSEVIIITDNRQGEISGVML